MEKPQLLSRVRSCLIRTVSCYFSFVVLMMISFCGFAQQKNEVEQGVRKLNAFSEQQNDVIPPDAILNLASIYTTTTTVLLSWTAPGESGVGQTAQYDIRYSTSPITEENFNSAMVAPNNLIPRSVGKSETFRVLNLAAATAYYFAVKSIDFFGNCSLISNIVEQATDIPPSISLSQSSFHANLLTAEKVIEILTIQNSGEGKLDFHFRGYNQGMYTPSVWSGTVDPGESLNVDIEISARGLLTGTYSPEFEIVSNDPMKDTLTISVVLDVTSNGFPIVEIQYGDSINFYDTYIDGWNYPDWKTISNQGSEPLFISGILSTNPLFSSRLEYYYAEPEIDTMTLAPFEEAVIVTNFIPVEIGLQTGEISIETSDPVKPVVTLYARGNGIKSPRDLVFSPTSIRGDTVYANEKYEFAIFLKNNGVEDLTFEFDEFYLYPLRYVPSSGTLSPGDSIEVKGILDTMGWATGQAEYYVVLYTDDPKFVTSRGTILIDLSLFIRPHEVDNFNLLRFHKGTIESTFSDTVIFDVADPDIEKYTIQANTSPSKVGSVKFTLDGMETNIDNSFPYIINHWLLPVLSEGYHVLTAQAFTESYAQGFEGPIRTTIIHVINSTFITDFDVVDSNGVKLMDLVEGSVIDLNQPGFNSFNIIANPSVSSIKSVRFTINTVTARIDNVAPYAMAGNAIAGDTFWKPKSLGQYTLTATPYQHYFGWGPRGTPLTVNFEVVRGTPSSSTLARTTTSTETSREITKTEETVYTENSLSVYPVPVVDELHMELHESIKGNIVLHIMNAQGQSVYSKEGAADNFRNHSVNTIQLGMSKGIYFVIVNQANGKRVVKKFIKE